MDSLNRQESLKADTYFRVMRLLQDNPDLTQRELAQRLGVSVGMMHYCLKALIEKGFIKVKRFAKAKNKFGIIYVLTPKGLGERAALASSFLKRKRAEYDALRLEIESLHSNLNSWNLDRSDEHAVNQR